MKTLWLDPFSGVSGDMFLGLLVDLGLDIQLLERDLAALELPGWQLQCASEQRGGICGTRVRVLAKKEQAHRHLPDILGLVERAELPDQVRQAARDVFRRLAEAEARVHGVPVDRVHFHEVGAVDAIIDIVGTSLGLFRLGIDRLVCGPVPISRGFVQTDHGPMPLPAPATAALLEGWPLTDAACEKELVTPTGAALVTALGEPGNCPDMRLEKTGYGVGGWQLSDRPNLLRGFLGETGDKGRYEVDRVVVVNAHIDDASPEWLGYLQETLLEAGVLDIAFAPLQMKKNRPATGLTVLAREEDFARVRDLVLREGLTAGLRWRVEQRCKLPRRQIELETPLGPARAKVLQLGNDMRLTPEYDDCRRLARQSGRSIAEVYRLVEQAAQNWRKKHNG
ncbi:MAG: nickel pincer cofactor biosynthesis protein LarC [Deltaproteobacteria bacterium]|nr:MAG: nickel pincer cofactor biosynthesis protein LarC [Deltaproteobacteria bacterium]